MPKKRPRTISKLSNDLLVGFIDEAVRTGEIDPVGKTDDELLVEIHLFFEDFLRQPGTFRAVLDHRPSLLGEARRMGRQGRHQLAVTLYAIWTEHWLNGLVRYRAVALGLTEEDVRTAIRTTQIEAKSGWLLSLLGLPRLSKTHVQAIRAAAEARNAFIHYKWVGQDVDTGDMASTQAKAIVDSYEATVRYLQAYERRHVTKNSIRRIRKALATPRQKPAPDSE